MTRRLEELKNEALRRFDLMREMFEKIHKIYEKDGYGTPAYMKVQHALSEQLMTIRFTAKTIEKLCDMVRALVDDVRKKEREMRRIIVDKCGMPQEKFVAEYQQLKEKQGENDVILFMDATHPQHNPIVGRGWIKRGQDFTILSIVVLFVKTT